MENVLQSNNQSNNYGQYLCDREKKMIDIELAKSNDESCYIMKEEQITELYTKQTEYSDFIFWLIDQKKHENDIIIVKDENCCDDRDITYEDTINCDVDDFYKNIGVDIYDFEKCFISCKYLQKIDVINLVIKVDGVIKRFILHEY